MHILLVNRLIIFSDGVIYYQDKLPNMVANECAQRPAKCL